MTGPERGRFRLRRGAATPVVLAGLSATLAAGVVALLVSIFEHKQEAKSPFFRVVAVDDKTDDAAIWGKNFPLQFELYKRTALQASTRYGGSQALPHIPTAEDPRTVVTQSKIDEDPRLKIMWAGYAFATDYRKKRGHEFMLEDQTYTGRVLKFKQPGSCLHCHGSMYNVYRKAGDGDLMKGFEKVNAMPFQEARKLVDHPVGCIDCHDPNSMQLRVTRPAFLVGIKAYKASQGIPNYDPNTMATRQEMRTYVCGQCHVEYYFKGPDKQLTFPWAKGLKVDQIVDYYDEMGFKDWTHAETGAPTLKAQHPEFETWSQGIHARSGVACADCHMPYTKSGAQKISDHQVRSPLLNINRACQTCHRWSEPELKDRVEQIQARFVEVNNLGMDALVDLIRDLKAAREAGRSDAELLAARNFQRRAQFYLDFVGAENSTGFHAPQESERIIATAIDLCRKGQNALRLPAAGPVAVARLK